MLSTLLSFAISLLIGLLIGIERERSHPEGVKFIGVRTFTLLSLLGTLVATLNELPLTITTSAFVFSMMTLNYIRSTSNLEKKLDIGIVTEITGGIIFILGYLVPSSPLIAIIVSAVVLLVLIERKRLHIIARKKFKPHEMETAIILIVFALGIIPILPNHPIDPWQVFNPRNFGILVATIAAIQFGGYLCIKLFGEHFGVALIGFLGGLISSTAVFATLSETLHTHPRAKSAIMASAILATLAMIIDIIIIIFVASPALLASIIWPMIVMLATGTITVFILLKYQKTKKSAAHLPSKPIKLLSLFRTTGFMALMLLIIAVAKRYAGTKTILLLAFLSGLFEIHGISLATALLYLDNQLKTTDARSILYVAIAASFISKFVLLWALTPRHFAWQTSLVLLIPLISGGAVYWFGM